MLPASDTPLISGGTCLLDGALLAIRTPVTVLHQASLERGVAPDQGLPGWAAIFIFWVS